MYILIIISLIFLGLVFGSFGSVIFYRLWEWPTKETRKWFLVWRSECPKCHHKLKARNLIPIFSFLFQWWKCEYCKSKISRFYPFLEISTVIIFLSVFIIFSKYWIPGYNIGLFEGYIFTIFITICAWLLRIILLYDIKTYELHTTATLFLYILSLLFILFFSNNKLEILLWMWIFIIMFLFIYLIWILVATLKYKKIWEWFWFWDVILGPVLWLRLVFFIQPDWLHDRSYLVNFFILLIGLIGFIYFLINFLIKKYFIKIKKNDSDKNSYVLLDWFPFFPSMIIATILEILFWDQLIYLWDLFFNWFINLFSV